MSRTFKAFSMDPKVHVPPQFPGATSDASRARASRHGSAWIGPWFLPLAALWSLLLAFRHLLYDLGLLTSQTGALPTLVVGNAELGGTGKTPHVLDLTRRLESLLGTGAVGILSRGYGRTTQDFQWVSQAPSWQEVGDEPWMMQSLLPSAPVAVGADRVRALQRMAADRPELRAVVLDDGLQHRALRPDLSIGLVSRPVPSRATGWANVLPAGPWRDLPGRLQRWDRLVITRPGAGARERDSFWDSRTRGISVRPMGSLDHTAPRLDGTCLLVTGVAQPHRVWESAVELGVEVAARAHYPDHHAFSEGDAEGWFSWMQANGVKSLLTTEKDAARLSTVLTPTQREALWVLPVEICWDRPELVDDFLKSWAQTLPS